MSFSYTRALADKVKAMVKNHDLTHWDDACDSLVIEAIDLYIMALYADEKEFNRVFGAKK